MCVFEREREEEKEEKKNHDCVDMLAFEDIFQHNKSHCISG